MTAEITVGSTVSHYQVISLLGKGGMGEVWLAEDTRLKRKVALKLLPAELTSDAERVQRFEQEAQAASALSHPNIIAIYDIGDDPAGKFIVMEYVSGGTLRSLVGTGIRMEEILDLTTQLAKAMQAAHSARITHRDIKPENIMLREDGYLKVLDFGLARLLPSTGGGEDSATLAMKTMPGTIMGTVAYMSPEQARGEQTGPATDIFSLGVVLYELATGTHPFKSDTLFGYLNALATQSPQPLDELRSDLPSQFTSLVSQMLHSGASSRPSADDLVEKIQLIRTGRSDNPTLVREMVETSTAIRTSGSVRDAGFWMAVLPFRVRGSSSEVESLAEGLSEDLVTGFSRFSYLRVIARSSTLVYRDYSGDLRTAGKELGARYVLEGSLRQSGANLRVAVQLVDTVSGANLWANSYDRKFSEDNIFELQDELVPRIVSTLADQHGILSRTMRESIRLKPIEQLSPYECVLRSFDYAERATPEALIESLSILRHAVEKSPTFAEAWAGIAGFYAQDFGQGFNLYEDPLGQGLKAAQMAIEADGANYLSWYSLAQIAFFRKDFLTFENAAEKALELNPLDAICTAFLGQMYLCAGRIERGLELANKARNLNPNHPGWYWYTEFFYFFNLGRFEEAASIIHKVNLPGHWAMHAFSAAAYGKLGQLDVARRSAEELLKIRPDFGVRARRDIEKWQSAEATEVLIEGLKVAGLEVD